MPVTKSASIKKHFADLSDPRRKEVTYPLINIVVIAICAVICGADDFVAIAEFGRKKRHWLRDFLDLRAGIPSHDRFNAILAAIKPAEFEKCLLSWITALHEIGDGQVIAIDGKTLRRSFDAASSKSAIHMVSAWASVNHISLGQVVVDAKSNEITAILKLLEILELSGSLVTIDAMGCQTEIALQIVDADADYCLAVKRNQPTLQKGIIDFFLDHMDDDFLRTKVRRYVTEEKGHGRQERREYYICPVPGDLPDRGRWKGIKAIGLVINITVRDGKETGEVRHYILSRYLSGRRFAEAVRGHWSIENRLHWQLDVTFGEDQCRVRKGHADTNFSILCRTALQVADKPVYQVLSDASVKIVIGSPARDQTTTTRYTLDGTLPTANSPAVDGPIAIDRPTVVWAQHFQGDQPVSPLSIARVQVLKPIAPISVGETKPGWRLSWWDRGADRENAQPEGVKHIDALPLESDQGFVFSDAEIQLDAVLKVPTDGVYRFDFHEEKMQLAVGAGEPPGKGITDYKQLYDMTRIDGKSGKTLWHKKEVGQAAAHYQVPWILDGKLHVMGGSGFFVDFNDGKLLGKHGYGLYDGCAEPRATVEWSFYTMSFTDRQWENHPLGIARSACDVGVFPAYGKLYVSPSLCGCNNYMNGYLAVAADTPQSPIADDARLDRTTAKVTAAPADAAWPRPGEWPSYMADSARSSYVDTKLTENLEVLWQAQSARFPESGPLTADWQDDELVGGPVSAATLADGRVLVAIPHEHRVEARDAATGKVQWEYLAGGRIDSPPTIYNPSGGDALCLFGSRDGRVHCLRADTSERLWTYLAAPYEKRVMQENFCGHGQSAARMHWHVEFDQPIAAEDEWEWVKRKDAKSHLASNFCG